MNCLERNFLLVLLVLLSSSQCQGQAGNDCKYKGKTYAPGDYIEGICAKIRCYMGGKWYAEDKSSECCDKCCGRDDPHWITTDGCKYDNHMKCNFSMVQPGFTYNPVFAVFNEFIDCPHGKFPGRTCVGPVTIKVNCDISVYIDLNTFDWQNPQVKVNGNPIDIASQPYAISSNPIVLAWRTDKCIKILHPNGMLVEYCITTQKKMSNNLVLELHSLCIYQPSCFKTKVWGLCGAYNGLQIGEFVHRDKRVEECETGKNPNYNFSPTWEKILGTCPVVRRDDEEAENVCPLKEVSERCATALKGLFMDDAHRQDEIGFCVTDLCAMKRSESSDEDIETHLSNTRDAVQRMLNHKPIRGDKTNRAACTGFPADCVPDPDHC